MAFEEGLQDRHKAEIWIPWSRFNQSESGLIVENEYAFKIAHYVVEYQREKAIWESIGLSIKKLIARNMHQILGRYLISPVDFVICWTPDGCEHYQDRRYSTGGTGYAIAAASLLNIPVFNLYNSDGKSRLVHYMQGQTL